MNELVEYRSNYNRFNEWVKSFNEKINDPDLKELETKMDFDNFIRNLDEAVDSIKEINSL